MDSNKELNEILYSRMSAEYDQFMEGLYHMESKEIIDKLRFSNIHSREENNFSAFILPKIMRKRFLNWQCSELKKKEYTVMSNHHLHNKKLSFKAKGLMAFHQGWRILPYKVLI